MTENHTDGDGVVDGLVQQLGGARSADDQSPAKGLRWLAHRRWGGDVLPHPQLPFDAAQTRDRTALCTGSYPLGPSRSSRFCMTHLNSYQFRQDL